MSKYCPICENEFVDTVVVCPQHQVSLIAQPIAHSAPVPTVDLYAALDALEAERLIGILAEHGIQAVFYENHVSIAPSHSDRHFMVAVDKAQEQEALRILRDAQKDGVISRG